MIEDWDNFTNIINECNKLKKVEVFILSRIGTMVTVEINGTELRGDFTSENFLNKIIDTSISSVKIDYSIPKEYSYLEPEEELKY